MLDAQTEHRQELKAIKDRHEVEVGEYRREIQRLTQLVPQRLEPGHVAHVEPLVLPSLPNAQPAMSRSAGTPPPPQLMKPESTKSGCVVPTWVREKFDQEHKRCLCGTRESLKKCATSTLDDPSSDSSESTTGSRKRSRAPRQEIYENNRVMQTFVQRGPQVRESDKIILKEQPTSGNIHAWMVLARQSIISASGRPADDIMRWVLRAEDQHASLEELGDA
eukprot:6484013-Amphidinium_carterae.1